MQTYTRQAFKVEQPSRFLGKGRARNLAKRHLKEFPGMRKKFLLSDASPGQLPRYSDCNIILKEKAAELRGKPACVQNNAGVASRHVCKRP